MTAPVVKRSVGVRVELKFAPMIAIAALAAGVIVALTSALSPAIPIVVIVVFVGGLAVVNRPELGLPIALVLLWTDSTGVAYFYHGLPSATAVIVPMMLIFPLVAGWLGGERMRLDEGFGWLVAYVLVEVVATIASSYPSVGLGRIEKTVQEGLIVYLLLINVVRTPEALRTSAWALIGSGSALALLTVVQVLGHRYDHSFFGFAQLDHQFFLGKEAFRAQGPVADPNYYAQILVTSLALAVVAMFRERTRRARVWAGLCATAMLLAIVFTYSRGGALALAVLIVLLAVFRYLRPRHLIGIVCVVGALLIVFPSYGSRVASLANLSGATAAVGSSDAADLSVQERATEDAAAWLVIKAHPILGVGPGGFPLVYQQYAQEVGGAIHQASKQSDAQGDVAGEAPQRAAPDILLSVGADEGLAGLSAFICLVGCAVIGLLRARRRWLRKNPQLEALATGYLLALISYVAAGAFLALAFERYLWALLALCGATTLLLRRPEETEADTARKRHIPRHLLKPNFDLSRWWHGRFRPRGIGE